MESTHKDKAIAFLRMVIEGKIAEAYDLHVSPAMRHHNAYYKSDAAALRDGMIENHERFPKKEFAVLQAVGEGDLVITRSRLRLSPDMPPMVAVHTFRFDGGKIVELWDTVQLQPEDMVNELGMF